MTCLLAGQEELLKGGGWVLLTLLRHSCACLLQVQEASVKFAVQLSSRPGESAPLWTVLSQAPASASGNKGLTASSSLQVKASPSAARCHHLVTTGFRWVSLGPSPHRTPLLLAPPSFQVRPGQGLFQEALLERLPHFQQTERHCCLPWVCPLAPQGKCPGRCSQSRRG